LFIDKRYVGGERAEDYAFIPARVSDNQALLRAQPDYLDQLKSLPKQLRLAWLEGRWDVFQGQFFPEFNSEVHVIGDTVIPQNLRRFAAMDYGLDMLALLICGVDNNQNIYVLNELCRPELTLGEAAKAIYPYCQGCEYIVASPDLWNRRQDSGVSGVELMSRQCTLPPMRPADDRRIAGWRVLHDSLVAAKTQSKQALFISHRCNTLIRSMSAILCDPHRPEDAASTPHELTHAPEALRYALMSRAVPPKEPACRQFSFRQRPSIYEF
jgi:phage terminase large subunit